MRRLRWVDGLRGLAAFSVCFNHLIYGEIKAPYRSFWDNPPQENRKLIQLPPFRLLFASKAMVPLFMVLGGYTISHGLIHLREETSGGMATLCRRVQSMAVRRFIRLYLPVLFLAIVAQALYFLDLFSWDFEGMGVLRGRKSFKSPLSHISYAIGFVVDLTDIIEFQFTRGFSNQIWTIPYEYRGSLVVCLLTLIFSAGWKTHLRLLILIAISTHLLWYNHWDVFCFVAGQTLAESQAAHSTRTTTTPSPRGRHVAWQPFLLIAGLHLFCLHSETEFPPDYRLLAHLQSPHWTKHNPWIDVQYNWHAIGALLVVSAVSSSATYQRQLERRVPQYLGRLSFSMYLVHEIVFRLWRNPLRDLFWGLCRGGGGYPGTDTAYEDVVGFLTAWIGAGVTLGVVTILVAEVYYHFVDQRFIAMAKNFERRASMKHSETAGGMGKVE